MKYHELLERQIAKFFPSEYKGNDEFRRFIESVNDAYKTYERHNDESDHAFRQSEKEYREINKQLKKEIKNREASIDAIMGAIHELEDISDIPLSDDSLPEIIEYFKNHVIKRQEAEALLGKQKRFYEHILNNIPADIAVFDKNHRYLFVNPISIKDPALREWLIGKNDEEYCQYRNRPMTVALERQALFAKAVNSKTQQEWEEKLVTADGSAHYNLRKLFPVFDANGELDIAIGYGIDITERKRIEEQIKLNEKRYRDIFDYSQALMCTHDLNGVVLNVNNAAIKTLGYNADELIGKPISSILDQNTRADFDAQYLEVIKKDGKAEGVMIAENKNGQKIYLLYQNYLVVEEGNEPYVIGFSQDITGRVNAEKAIKKSEEKYRNIIASMNLGLMEVDRDETIIYVNHSFCEMSGYEFDELVGKTTDEFFVREDNKEIVDQHVDRRRRGISDAYELSIKTKSGEIKWWLISGAPVVNTNGEYVGSIGIHLDISDQKKLEMELRSAKIEAEYSAQVKETFLANMSHEIRTPMNAIMGLGRLLQKTELENQQRFYIDSMQNAAGNLLVIVNDILDFSKIEAGKISLENIGFKLVDLVENSLSVLKHKAEEKGLSLTKRMDSRIADILIGDPYRINQVMMNLLSNALKFTSKGKIHIECMLLNETPGSQNISITISDTGKGMSKEFLRSLFDKFTQEDASVTRKFGGTGLGMSISKQLVELMGGMISVLSEKGKGTNISITLTLPIGDATQLPHKDISHPDIQILREKKILLVEDNEMNRLVAYTVLNQYGASITEAENGVIAIEKLQEDNFDLILMDIQMPEKDGIETTEYIRAHLDRAIPIIALTANALKGEEEKCLNAGMNDFITKPFEEEKMVQLIAKWLGRENRVSANTFQNVKEEKLYSLEKLLEFGDDNSEFVTSMLELFATEMPDAMNQMKDAMAADDWKTVGSLAHRIKPTILLLSLSFPKEDILHIEAAEHHEDKAPIRQLVTKLDHVIHAALDQIAKTEMPQG